jgi:2-polyprenyl-3-methyl-5-hydroxy-6-metoxy-1,4-benzoquinol methylase
MIEYSQCPVCKSQLFDTVIEATDFLVSGESFKISECRECTLRFTNPVPDEKEIAKYYRSGDYISHSNTSEGLINKIYQFVRNYTLQSKRKQIQKETGLKSGTILDIGCGSGEFLNKMKNSGWQVDGIEPDEGARQLANHNYQLEIETPEKLSEFPAKNFDVITLWHVLEHIHQLDKNMVQLTNLLKPDGTLFVAVPNYHSFDAKYYGSGWAAYDVPRHLYHFTVQAMATLLDRYGLQLKKLKMMPFDSFYVSMLREKYKKESGGFLRAMSVGLKSNLKAIPHTGTCSSITYIVQHKHS